MRKSAILAARGIKNDPEADAGAESSANGSRAVTPRPATPNPSDFKISATNFGALLGAKPFKVPTSLRNKQKQAEGGGRKRKVVDYKGMGGGGSAGDDDDDHDAESEPARKKPKKNIQKLVEGIKGVDENGRSLIAVKKYAVFKPKEVKSTLKSTFKIPTMKDKKTGEIVETRMTAPSLGMRIKFEIPPRPLFDPMQDQAIVLYDPTIQDRQTEKEMEKIRLEQLKYDEALQEEKDSQHKSLARILGLDRKDKLKVVEKVPVVVDPKLGKILRPHQIEGVKVSE